MQDVFISYSTKDQTAKDELVQLFDKEKISYFLDAEDLPLGANIEQQLKQNLKNTGFTVMLVSKNSLFSTWVGMEAMHRLQQESFYQTTTFLPILIDKDVLDIGFPIEMAKVFKAKQTELEALREKLKRMNQRTEIYDVEINRLSKIDTGDILMKIWNSRYIDFSNEDNKPKEIKRLIQTIKNKTTEKINNPDKPIHPEKHLTTPPPQPEVFLGRDDDLEALYHRLFNQNSSDHILLLVNGQGGIGKTSLAVKYYHQYQHKYHRLAWLLAEPSILEAILQLARPLKVDFPNEMPNEERLNELLREMANLDKPCLLILDNANAIEDLEKHYKDLRRCANFHLLLTTRITHFAQAQTYPVNGLSDDFALDLFKRHYPNHQAQEDALVLKIYTAVGRNTLVMEILAKNLHNINSRLKIKYPLPMMWQDIQAKGLLAIQQNTKGIGVDWHEWEIQQAPPEEIIKAMYDLEKAQLSEAEKSLLSVFAVLPAENIAFATLETLLATENLDETLLLLAQKGWLDYSEVDVSFRCSPVVQEITRTKNQTRLRQDCESLVCNLMDELHLFTIHIENFKYSSLYVRYAESILLYLQTLEPNLAVLCERIGTFYTTIGNLENAFIYFEKFKNQFQQLVGLEPNNSDFKDNLAISFEKLGNTFAFLGNLDKALEYYVKCNRFEKELYESYPNHVDFKNGLAISYERLGKMHKNLGNLDKATKYFEEETQLFEELYESYPNHVDFKNNLAISYSNLGNIYSSLGNLNKAIEYFEEYNKLEKELYESYPNHVDFKNNLAISYSNLGNIYSSLGNLNKAIEYFEEEYKLKKELYESYPNQVAFKNSLAISYSNLGDIYSSLGNLGKTLEYFEEYNRLEKELYTSYPNHVDFKNNLASSYSNLGDTQKNLDNLDKALEYFEEHNRIIKELYTSYPNQVSFKNSLAISYERLGDIYALLGNLNKALEYFEEYNRIIKELHTSYPNYVSFKSNLVISYSLLGVHFELIKDLNQARIYYKQCEQLYLELVRDFPTYVEFQRNLQWVQNRLAGL
jgi:tetratricopeptide (TPR) repeat protein